MSCYQSSGKRPLKDPKTGGKDYTVGKERLAEALASGRNLTVVAYGECVCYIYADSRRNGECVCYIYADSHR